MILDPKLAKMTHDAVVLAIEQTQAKSMDEIFQGLLEGVIKAAEFRRKMAEATIKAMIMFEQREEIYQEFADSLGLPGLTKEEKQQALLDHILKGR